MSTLLLRDTHTHNAHRFADYVHKDNASGHGEKGSKPMLTPTATSEFESENLFFKAGIAHPFGDERSVTQAFPTAIPS
jgi:hypothetical protein